MTTKEQALAAPLTVLVVDDDPDVLRVTEWMLQESGFHVLTGATAAAALELTHRHHPALVLLDVMLPDGSGVGVARQLKSDPALADVFVILYSGTKISSDDQAKGLAEGFADGYMVRPLRKPELLARIEAFLRIRETQRALRESEQSYRLLADHTTDVVWLSDMDMRITYQSPSSERLRGFTTQELHDLPLDKNLTPESLKAVLDLFHAELPRIAADPGYDPVITAELEYYRKDGSAFWSESKFSIIRDGSGKPVSILGEGRDITERRQARQARRESEERHQAILRTTLDGFWLTDTAGRLLEVNEAYCRMTGYSEAELLAMRVSDLEAEETATDVAARMKKIVAQGADRFESRHRRKDGSLLDVEISVRYEAAGGGRFAGFLRDVTEQREVEAQARASAALYRRIVETAREGIWAMDSEHCTTFVNPQMAAMLGYEVDEMLGRVVTELMFEEDLDARAEAMREQSRLELGSSQARLRRKDGVEVWALVSSAADLSPEGEFLGSFGMFTDVTERKRAEEQLAHSHNLLANLARLVPSVIYQYRLYPDGSSAFPYSSPGMNDIYECTPEEVREDATPVFGRLHPDDAERVGDLIQESARTLDEFYCEFRVILPRQGLRWRWSQAHPERTEDGGTLWHGIISDITERKQAEDALRESEEKYRMVADFTYDWEAWAAPDGAYRWVSPSCERITGHAAAEFMADPDLMVQIAHPDDRPKIVDHYEAAACEATREALHLDFRILTADGDIRWISHWCTAVYGEGGQRLGRRESNRDITQRMQAEESLRESENKYRSLVENISDVVFTVDPEGRFTYMSPVVEGLIGYAPEEMVGVPFLRFIHEDDLPLLRERFQAMLAGDVAPANYRLVAKSGDVRWVRGSSRPVIVDGKALGIQGLVSDITEIKQAEEALRQANDRLSLATRAGGVGVWDYDVVNDTLTWDEQMFRLYGITREQFGGAYEAWRAGLHPDDMEHGDAEIQMALRGEKELDSEFRVLWPDGTTRDIRALALVQRDAAGRPTHMIGTNWDITERKRVERELLESLAGQMAVTEGVIAALAHTVEVRDPYTAGHQRRVSELAAAMALQMALGAERAEGLRVAGMLHDVGKIKIPSEILSKPGRLTTIELELIKGHAQAGYEILAAIHFPWPVAEIARQHHERLDGSGYPDGLTGEEILPEARILAVADVVEAVASHRPYRPALGIEAALAEVLGGAGTLYDAVAVVACEQVFKQGFVFSEA